MMHRAGSSIVEVPYCFSRSYIKFQGHTALKIVEFDPNWAFPDSNSSLNSPMAMKCCTKLETAKERCPIVFQCHPSNFKVTRDKTSPILTQIGRFRTIGRSQLSNPSDLPCSSKSAHMNSGLQQWREKSGKVRSFSESGKTQGILLQAKEFCIFNLEKSEKNSMIFFLPTLWQPWNFFIINKNVLEWFIFHQTWNHITYFHQTWNAVNPCNIFD